MKRAAIIIGALAVLLSGAALLAPDKLQFMAGGALVNLGYRLQDPIEAFDFHHGHDISPSDVWRELIEQNTMAASVRQRFPRTPHHPLVAVVACMDARLDTLELVGDTRKWYYFVRTAGSVMAEKEEEMLELAVASGVKVIAVLRHTDCAAEAAAKDPAKRALYPALAAAVDGRAERMREFLARPSISARVESGELLVREFTVDTTTQGAVDLP